MTSLGIGHSTVCLMKPSRREGFVGSMASLQGRRSVILETTRFRPVQPWFAPEIPLCGTQSAGVTYYFFYCIRYDETDRGTTRRSVHMLPLPKPTRQNKDIQLRKLSMVILHTVYRRRRIFDSPPVGDMKLGYPPSLGRFDGKRSIQPHLDGSYSDRAVRVPSALLVLLRR